MAVTLPEEVGKGGVVEWKPVRELADAVSQLYSEKKIFTFASEEPGTEEYGISTESMRVSDKFANKCLNNSADENEDGCVYLTADITAPFRLTKLGTGESTPKEQLLAFEFAYNPAAYKEYLNGSKLPVLVTQYLVYPYTPTNDAFAIDSGPALPLIDLLPELTDAEDKLAGDTVCNLIESRRDKIKKFWDNGNTYSTEKEVAGELYMIVEDSSSSGCNSIARIAWAGLNNNSNGNSPTSPGGGRPAGWVNGNICCGSEGKFVSDDPWMSGVTGEGLGKAVTLTGVNWDRKPGESPSTKGFKPETPTSETEEVTGYPPPPIGCCAEFVWPSIGLEGGGSISNSFYKPSSLSTFIAWADWRAEYQEPLTAEQIQKAKTEDANLNEKSIPDDRFPCHTAEGYSGDKPESYNYFSSSKSKSTRYQRWIQPSSDTYIRLAPLEFNAEDSKKAYLVVPLTVIKVLKPKSYQTAIRKRWYDMIYYSLRNIAGYKYVDYNDITNKKIIGVTWKNDNDFNADAYLNPCVTSNDENCACNKCKYERWKYMELGGESNSEKLGPFVGPKEYYVYYNNDASKNVAQLWQWDDDRYKVYTDYAENKDVAYFFPELYFEKLICYKNNERFADPNQNGGFKLTEEEDQNAACGCFLSSCKGEGEDGEVDIIKLPWEGGGANAKCYSTDSYSTHAYTFNRLRYLAKFIIDYKADEDVPIGFNDLELGSCYSVAKGYSEGELDIKNINPYRATLTQGTPLDDDPWYKCPEKGTVCYDGSGGCYVCTQIKEQRHILPVVPAYYNTKSTDEKFKVLSSGTSIVINTEEDTEEDTKKKAYGYNAYIWKAIDLGGKKLSQEKDLTITFTHYKPARNCGLSTMLDLEKSLLVPAKDQDATATYEPLYLYDTTKYELDSDKIDDYAFKCQIYQYSHCGTYEPNKRYTNDSASINATIPDAWDTIVDNAAHDFPAYTEQWKYRYMSPIITGNTPLWFTDNAETSIGAMDIYLAPVTIKDGGSGKYKSMAKLIGYCTFNMNPASDGKNYDCGDTYKSSLCYCDDYFEGICAEEGVCVNLKEGGTLAGNSCTVVTKPTTAANDNELIEVVGEGGDSKTITTTPGTEGDVFTTKIKIPYQLLFNTETDDTSEQGAYTDQRRQYIILALRASHTHINSWADGNTTVDLNGTTDRDKNLAQWAMNYASACRYAPFKVQVDLERNSTN